MSRASLEELYSEPSDTSRGREDRPSTESEPDRLQHAVETEPEPTKSEAPNPDSTPDKAPDTGEPAKAKKDVPPASDEDGDVPADVQGLMAAVKAERQKRNDWKGKYAKAEADRAEVLKKLQDRDELLMRHMQQQQVAQEQQQQTQVQQPRQRPDPFTDPEGALAYERELFGQALQYQAQQQQAAMQQQSLQQQQSVYERSVEVSERIMRAQHPDYDEVKDAFAAAAYATPQLREALIRHPFPAEYAYQVGREIMLQKEIREAGSLDAWADRRAQAKLAELQARAAQTASAPIQPKSPPHAPPPQSLAGVPSVAPRNRPANTGRTPLDDLYKT